MMRSVAPLFLLSLIREVHATVLFRIPKADRQPTNARVVDHGAMQYTFSKGVKLDDDWAIKFPSGAKMNTFPEGVRVLETPDGKVTHYLPDGRVVDTLPTGESRYILPSGEYWQSQRVSPFAEEAFKSWQPLPPLSLVQDAHSSFDSTSITAVSLIGFLVSSGVVFMVRRFRSSILSSADDYLLLV